MQFPAVEMHFADRGIKMADDSDEEAAAFDLSFFIRKTFRPVAYLESYFNAKTQERKRSHLDALLEETHWTELPPGCNSKTLPECCFIIFKQLSEHFQVQSQPKFYILIV